MEWRAAGRALGCNRDTHVRPASEMSAAIAI
jgi:hypothetical protein